MSWLGTGIGAGIGLFLGGPIGAGIGAWIGSALSNNESVVACPHCNTKLKVKSEGQYRCPHCHKSFRHGDSKGNQTVFFVTLCSMMGKMAIADGEVCSNEIDTVMKFFDKMKLGSEEKNAGMTIFKNATTDNYTIYDYAQQYSKISDYEMREVIYAMLWDIANADGVLHPSEDEILKKLPSYLGLPQSRYNEYRAPIQDKPQSDIAKSYEILGCSESDSDQTIKQKYRKAVAEYHPDKIQSKGLPEAFVEFANQQMQKINEAYETIKKHRKL